MKTLALVLLVMMVGCSYNPTAVQIEIDSSFSQEKKELIIQSMNDWAVKTNGGFGISSISYPNGISSDTEDNCIKFINQDVEEDKAPEPNLTILGLTDTMYSTPGHPTDHVQATIYIWDGEPDTTFGATARHELGHAFNLGHYCTEAQGKESWTACEAVSTDPEPAIMYPTLTSGTLVVQPIDVFRFCTLWSCPQ
jgi:hypothetical protein